MEVSNTFTVNDIAIKWKSKSELYNVLMREGNIYLPPKQDATQKYLRALMLGKKQYIKWSEVIVVQVPQYDGLRVKDLLKLAESEFEINDFLPIYDYNKEPNRVWLCNLINTLIPEKFKEFINLKIKKRNQELIESQNLGIHVKSEFIDIFNNSQSISTMKGKSHFLARAPKKIKDQLKVEKVEEERKEAFSKVEELKRNLESLKFKMEEYKVKQRDADINTDKLSKLYELGLIDENGDPINNDMS